jgi:carbonic anhydrase
VGDVKARGPKLVLGVFFKVVAKVSKGAKDRSSLYALNEKISLAVTKQGDKAACKIVHAHDINPAHFLPDDDQSLKQFYRYEGSLTTEPFSEDVSWYVVRGHAAVSKTQVNQLQICAEQEARPAHALDRRFILRSF